MATPRTVLSDRFIGSQVLEAENVVTRRDRVWRILIALEAVADALSGAVGVIFSYLLSSVVGLDKIASGQWWQVAGLGGIVGVAIVLLLDRDGAYEAGGSLLRIRDTERALRMPTLALLLFLPLVSLLKISLPHTGLVIAFGVIPALLVVQKALLSPLVIRLGFMGKSSKRVLIYGAGYTGRRVLSALLQSPKLGLTPAAIIDDNPALANTQVFELGYRHDRSVPVLGGPITPELLRAIGCEQIVMAIPSLSAERFARVTECVKRAGMRVAFLHGVEIPEREWSEPVNVDGMMLVAQNEPDSPWYYPFLKRCLDVSISFLLLLAISPFAFIIAILIAIDSPGPVLFVQERVGKQGRIFKMYKFRSMRTDAPRYGSSPTESSDTRITRVGKFLRKSSMDELPQLINVFLGDMSLVGPRPEMKFIVDRYDARQLQRLLVLPGVTGLWQISADRIYQIHESIQYDLYYIRHRSFFLDIAILMHTALFAARGV